MLVLTRRIDQKILINKGTIQIKVLKIEDDIISIGINAPQHIDIDREEIYIKKQQQQDAEAFMRKVAV